MCGRYRLTRRRLLEIEHYYGVDDVNDLDIWERQFNIPPRKMAPIVLRHGGRLRLTAGLWSLLPPWAEHLDYANTISTFNAKAETLTQKPTFKNAFLKRRCIVPAEAFYEWLGPKGKSNRFTFRGVTATLSPWQDRTAIGNQWDPKADRSQPSR